MLTLPVAAFSNTTIKVSLWDKGADSVVLDDAHMALMGKMDMKMASTGMMGITVDKASVKAGLALMDSRRSEVWAKLDAGTGEYYQLVNRSYVRFDRILHNLLATARVRPIVIQSLFLKVNGARMPEPELDAYCGRLSDIVAAGGRIKEVHAYTVARPTPETWATRLNALELEAIAATIARKTGLPVEIFD